MADNFAQSGDKILFANKSEDGLYLGSIPVIVLGAIAGLLVSRSYVPQQITLQNQLNNNLSTQTLPLNQSNQVDFILEVLFTGLALKGIAEAASGNQVNKKESTVGSKQARSNLYEHFFAATAAAGGAATAAVRCFKGAEQFFKHPLFYLSVKSNFKLFYALP